MDVTSDHALSAIGIEGTARELMGAYASPGTGDPATGAAVRSLVNGASIEVIPLRTAGEKLKAISAGATVTVTTSGKLGLDRTLEFAGQAARAGYTVVPHLAARQLTSEEELRGFIGRLGELGISELYLIGGDATPPAGPYDSSLQVLEAMRHIDHGVSRIGVACYPEGHPKISDAALAGALRAKQPHAAYMVSQLCFSPEVLVSWLRRVREQGITLPLHLGLAAPMQVTKLIKLGPRIGVGTSVRYLAKQHGFIGSVLKGGAYQPESLLLKMGDALTSPELGIEGLHLFSFNQVEETVKWQRDITVAPSGAAG
jgi:methylenetetrahydrofolate reductase (NADPH)